jgi:hypothetical protein
MIYLWAAIRTILILFGVLIAIFVVLLLASAVVQAFLTSWIVGSLALAFVCGVMALFGHQLVRVAKTDRARAIGAISFGGFTAVALVALAVPVEIFVWTKAVPWLLAKVGLVL